MCSRQDSTVLEHFHRPAEFLHAHGSQLLRPRPVLGDDLLSFPVSLTFLGISYINGIIQIEYLHLASVTKHSVSEDHSAA